MSLATAIDMYNSTLKGVRKKRTSAIWPKDFNILINEAKLEWLRDKVKESDLTQQRMDDLEALRYITDSTIEVLVSTTTETMVGGEVNSDTFDSVTGLRTIVEIDSPVAGDFTTTVYQRLIPIAPRAGTDHIFDVLPLNYPAYYRLQSIQSNLIYEGVTYGPISSKPLKSDRRADILTNPYKKPLLDTENIERSRIYHQYLQGRLHLLLPDNVSGQDIIVEYIKPPIDIYVDANNSANNVDSELGSDQQQQIVDIAVRMYIESTQSQRYESVLAEEQIKQTSK